ncbi:MAG: hypothetical protein WBB67_07290 [bacterium]
MKKKKLWEMGKEEFARHYDEHAQFAIKDLETGKIYAGPKGRDEHANILEKIYVNEGINLVMIEAGIIFPDDEFYASWQGKQIEASDVGLADRGIDEFRHNIYGEEVLMFAKKGMKPPPELIDAMNKSVEKDNPEDHKPYCITYLRKCPFCGSGNVGYLEKSSGYKGITKDKRKIVIMKHMYMCNVCTIPEHEPVRFLKFRIDEIVKENFG